ncbi:MAG: cyclic nucleotide-binding domain-containing protein [Clostridiales bacterium]|jgi:CRP-like cAMP-binding protein|nr:cyclic nucleotide-binding domain-containing protein [Clostridiales bacterium]
MKNILSLKKSPLFQGVSEEELGSLVKCLGCTLKSYGKGETVYLVGDFVREIGIVVTGRVHIVKIDAWGNSNIIAEISAGEMFAEAVVCGGVGVLPVTVVAAVDTEAEEKRAQWREYQRKECDKKKQGKTAESITATGGLR